MPDESSGQDFWRISDDLGNRLQVFWIPSAGKKFIHFLLILIELKDDDGVRILYVITEKIFKMPRIGSGSRLDIVFPYPAHGVALAWLCFVTDKKCDRVHTAIGMCFTNKSGRCTVGNPTAIEIQGCASLSYGSFDPQFRLRRLSYAASEIDSYVGKEELGIDRKIEARLATLARWQC